MKMNFKFNYIRCMKLIYILLILIDCSIISQGISLNGYWELVDYEDGKVKYTLGTETYSQGMYFTDSTVQFFENIYFSNLLSDRYSWTKEYKKEYSGNYFNKRNYTISDNKLYIPLYGNVILTELVIKKISKDTLILRNEAFDYEQIYRRKEYSDVKPINFSKITFSTSYCLGDCPVYDLEIDSVGFLKFEGKDHLSYLGKYEYKLDDSLLNELKNLINIINWQELDYDYFGIMHGPKMETKIYCKDTIFKEIKDHTGPVSCELKWLYNFFEVVSQLPFKQKTLEENIFGDKTLKIRKISKNKSLTGFYLLDNKNNDYILSELLKTENASVSFVPKYYLAVYELIWDNKTHVMLEKDVGIIESDGLYFKLNSKVYKCYSEDLTEYFDAIINNN